MKYLLILTLIISCSSNNPDQKSLSCQEKFKIDGATKIASKAKELGGSLASYTVTGAAYTGEFVVEFSSGIAQAIIFCAPGIALSAFVSSFSSTTAHNLASLCMGDGIKVYQGESVGTKVYYETKKWRCPMFSKLTKSIRGISRCHYKKNTTEGTSMALEQMSKLMDQPNYRECITRNDHQLNEKLMSKLLKETHSNLQ